MFKTVPEKPWLSENGIFLLFDYVHLLKSIRNNWITEKVKELEFFHDSKKMTAKWSAVENLYKIEKNNFIKQSLLNEAAVYPKPIE